MIKTVIFDIDNTLYDYDVAHRAAFSAVSAYASEAFGWDTEVFAEKHSRMQRTLCERMEEGSVIHNRLIRYQNLLEKEGLPLYPHAVRMTQIYWQTLLGYAVVTPGAATVLGKLKDQGFRIGIGTDMTAYIQFRKLEQLGLLSYIDFVVTSEEAQAEKPSEKFFALCLEKAGCPAENCLFVGDHRQKDVEGARAAGMQARWFLPGKTEFVKLLQDLWERD